MFPADSLGSQTSKSKIKIIEGYLGKRAGLSPFAPTIRQDISDAIGVNCLIHGGISVGESRGNIDGRLALPCKRQRSRAWRGPMNFRFCNLFQPKLDMQIGHPWFGAAEWAQGDGAAR